MGENRLSSLENTPSLPTQSLPHPLDIGAEAPIARFSGYTIVELVMRFMIQTRSLRQAETNQGESLKFRRAENHGKSFFFGCEWF